MPVNEPNARRANWMAILARATAGQIEDHLQQAPPIPSHTSLRGPEVGLIMVRGRAGGGGTPFNLGEMTVARCTVRNADARIGHGYVPGRDLRHAELAAMLDAALQDPALQERLSRAVIEPLAVYQEAVRCEVARKSAATRVEFVTMAAMR